MECCRAKTKSDLRTPVSEGKLELSLRKTILYCFMVSNKGPSDLQCLREKYDNENTASLNE